MAFNWQTFRTRTVTAIVFAAVMLTGLLWNHWSFLVLFSIIHFGCWWEYLKLSEKIGNSKTDILDKSLFIIAGYFVFFELGFYKYHYDAYIGYLGLSINLTLLIIAFLFGLLWFTFFTDKEISLKTKLFNVAGLVYISVSFGLMVNLRNTPIDLWPEIINSKNLSADDLGLMALYEQKAIWLCLLIVFSMWINDTMAYIVGSLIGKTPLSKISPKKTWEGTIGGILLASVILGLTGFYFLNDIFVEKHSVWVWITLILVATVAGTFGDLLESKLKRMAGVKDSGSFMPGHGGFLDRFDSLLLATPFVWLYVYFFI